MMKFTDLHWSSWMSIQKYKFIIKKFIREVNVIKSNIASREEAFV